MNWLDILQAHWGMIFWGVMGVWIMILMTFSKSARAWFNEQWEWFKKILVNDDAHPDYPDHKNFIMVVLALGFIADLSRFMAYSKPDTFPDIPEYWALFFFASIGALATISLLKEKITDKKIEDKNTPENKSGT